MRFPVGVLTVAAATATAALMIGTAGCQSNPDQTATNNETNATPAAQATMGAAERAGKNLDEAGAKAKQETREAAADTGAAVHHAGQDIKQGAENAGAAVSDATADASKSTQNAMAPMVLTPKVKTALGANRQLDGSNINVDTRTDSHQVVLSGTVVSSQQKAIAGQVAAGTLKENKSTFSVKNDLVIGNRAASAK